MSPKNIYIDDYIDDIITVTYCFSYLIKRAQQAVPLALHCIFRPIAHDEPIHRDPTISMRKLSGEGQLSDSKDILGWIVNATKFKIFLPYQIFLAWSEDIDQLIQNPKTTAKALEILIGKLNHAAYFLPLSRYFLTRLRYRQQQAERFSSSSLTPPEIEDLQLWKHF